MPTAENAGGGGIKIQWSGESTGRRIFLGGQNEKIFGWWSELPPPPSWKNPANGCVCHSFSFCIFCFCSRFDNQVFLLVSRMIVSGFDLPFESAVLKIYLFATLCQMKTCSPTNFPRVTENKFIARNYCFSDPKKPLLNCLH